MVIYAHSHGFTNEHEDILYRISRHSLDFSFLGLSVFFFLSGLLVTQSLYQSSSWRNFLWKRFLRLYPAAWLAILFCMLLLGPLLTGYSLRDYFSDPLFYNYAISLTLVRINYYLPGVFTNSVMGPSVNASLWSLGLEWKLYAGLLIFYCLNIPFKKIILFILLATLVIVDQFLYGSTELVMQRLVGERFALDPYTVYTPYFLAGILCYLFRSKIIINRYVSAISFLFLIGTFLLASLSVIKLIVIPILVLQVAAARFKWMKKITPGPDLSYGLYVFAFPLQQMISQFLGTTDIHPWQFALLSIFVTLPFAIFSWYMVEKKALSLKRRIS